MAPVNKKSHHNENCNKKCDDKRKDECDDKHDKHDDKCEDECDCLETTFYVGGRRRQPFFATLREVLEHIACKNIKNVTIKICEDSIYGNDPCYDPCKCENKCDDEIVIRLINSLPNSLKIIGDTRPIVGFTFVNGSYWNFPIENVNLGGGLNSIAALSGAAGDTSISVTNVGVGSSPNFALSDVVAGDKVLIRHNSGPASLRFQTYTVASVTGSTITFSSPLIGNANGIGASLTVLPNITINSRLKIRSPVTLVGLRIVNNSNNFKTVTAKYADLVTLIRTVILGGSVGFSSLSTNLKFIRSTIARQTQTSLYANNSVIQDLSASVSLLPEDSLAGLPVYGLDFNQGVTDLFQTVAIGDGLGFIGLRLRHMALKQINLALLPPALASSTGFNPVTVINGGVGFRADYTNGNVTGLRVFGGGVSYIFITSSHLTVQDAEFVGTVVVGIEVGDKSILNISFTNADVSAILLSVTSNSTVSAIAKGVITIEPAATMATVTDNSILNLDFQPSTFTLGLNSRVLIERDSSRVRFVLGTDIAGTSIFEAFLVEELSTLLLESLANRNISGFGTGFGVTSKSIVQVNNLTLSNIISGFTVTSDGQVSANLVTINGTVLVGVTSSNGSVFTGTSIVNSAITPVSPAIAFNLPTTPVGAYTNTHNSGLVTYN